MCIMKKEKENNSAKKKMSMDLPHFKSDPDIPVFVVRIHLRVVVDVYAERSAGVRRRDAETRERERDQQLNPEQSGEN